MVAADGSEARARLAELQRRLYRPDATAADVERYTALRDELAAVPPPAPAAAPEDQQPPSPAALGPEQEVQPAPAVDPAVRRPSRSLLIGGALAGTVAFCAAIALLQPPADGSAPVARSSVSSTPLPASRTEGGSQQLSERLNGDAATPVGTTVEVSVDGGRMLAQRFSGSGPAIVPLVTGGAPLNGGLLTVTLHSAGRGAVSWTLEPPAGQPFPTLALGAPTIGGASDDAAGVEYRGAPPSDITVRAPAGTGWTLVVAFSR